MVFGLKRAAKSAKKKGRKPESKKRTIDADPSVLGEHAPTIQDLMTTASGFTVSDTELYISPSGYTRCYYVTALPSSIPFGYLNPLFLIGADVHVSIHAEPADSAPAMRKRTKRMTVLEGEIMSEQKAGTNKRVSYLQDQYALLEFEREALRSGREKLFYVTIVFTVSSPDHEEFEEACRRIEREMPEGFVIRDAYKEHDLGLRSVAPIGMNVLRHPIEMTGSALANSFLFSNSKFSHEYGVPIGIDFSSGHLNRYDAWASDERLLNANMVIGGTSGAGKSFLVKGLTARGAAFGVRHVIVDFEGEYNRVSKAMGWVTIRIDARSPHRLNAFELEEEDEREEENADALTGRKVVKIDEKIEQIERLVLSMAHIGGESDRLDAYSVAAINEILQTMYTQDFGFTENADSLYETLDNWQRDSRGNRLVRRRKRPQPQFSDFYDRLAEHAKTNVRLEDAAMRLRRFRAGGTMGMFDCQSTVELRDVPVVHFDLSTLSGASLARELGIQVVLEWVMEQFIKRNPGVRKRVVLDEAQEMLKRPDMAQFLEDAFRRIRKRGGSAVAASQDLRKFLVHAQGQAITQNSATRVLLQQTEQDRALVTEVLGLKEGEFEELLHYKKGEARWDVAGEVFYNQMNASDLERQLFSTTHTRSERERIGGGVGVS